MIFFSRIKEANALRSSHIEQSAIYVSSHGRLSTGYNWKRSKCEERGPEARRVSWAEICSKILTANRTKAIPKAPEGENSQRSSFQEISHPCSSPKSQIKLQFGANDSESDLIERRRTTSSIRSLRQMKQNDSFASGIGLDQEISIIGRERTSRKSQRSQSRDSRRLVKSKSYPLQ